MEKRKCFVIASLVLIALIVSVLSGCAGKGADAAIEDASKNDPDEVAAADELLSKALAGRDLAGQAAFSTMRNQLQYLSCVDSDGGTDHGRQGYVFTVYKIGTLQESIRLTDRCEGRTLLEYYCYNKRLRRQAYGCPGTCTDGVCAETAPQAVQVSGPLNLSGVRCHDSDGGQNIFEEGYVAAYNGTVKMPDLCIVHDGISELTEYFCDNGSAKAQIHICDFGCGANACNADPCQNLALAANGAVAYASSQPDVNMPASKVNDGCMLHSENGIVASWDSGSEAEQPWIEIDFGKQVRISKTVLTFVHDCYPVDYRIQVHDSGGYKDLLDSHDLRSEKIVHDFAQVNADKIRLIATALNKDRLHLAEFEVYNRADCPHYACTDTDSDNDPNGCESGACILKCKDECSDLNLNKCLNTESYQTCGNYDSDSCLEWSKPENCQSSSVCQNGSCVYSELRTASILDVPLPENSKCFFRANSNLPECSQYYDAEKSIACPKFYNPVYDSKGVFYPSACWAEHFSITNYQYGYSSRLKQFINDLWFTKKNYQNQYFKVPIPNIEFTYQGSGSAGWRNGVFLRSVLWENGSKANILDYNIDTQDGTQQSTSLSESNTLIPVYGTNPKSLLVFVMFDDAYPENILLEWTNIYEPLMNDYIKKKQKVPNPIQYDLVPVVINPPEGVEMPSSPDHLYFTQEEIQKVFDTATSKIGQSNFDILVISPVFLNGFGGYCSWWNNMQFIEAPLIPFEPYSNTDKQKGLNALSAFQSMMLTISHEIFHAVGLPGDHVPMLYGTTYLDAVGQDVDPVTGKKIIGEISWCDFFGKSPDYYSVEIPNDLGINLGDEPQWLYKSESSTGPCLSGLDNNEWLKDYDNDGKYEIMYKNNLIGIELQRALGWVDIDGDQVTELIDNNPYGGYKKIEMTNLNNGELIGPFKFTFIEYQNIGSCKFGKIRLENNLTGLVPLECPDFNDDVVNIYNGINYHWVKIEDSRYGTVLLARLSNY